MKSLIMTALVMIAADGFMVRAEAPGLYVSGHASATDTEKAEQMIAIGQDILIQVRDQSIYDRQILPLVGHTVKLCLVEDDSK